MQKANFKFESLQDQFKSAWQFLKQTKINEFTNPQALQSLPWYLVIGPTGSGKSHLIKQSGLHFIPSPHLSIDPADESDDQHRCNWWFTDKMTLLDIPGHYLTEPHWENFLKILAPYNEQKPFGGIILTINLPEWSLQTKAEQKKYIQFLHDVLFMLNKTLENTCPLHTVLTKADNILGFNEFFADLGQEEREQALGIQLAKNDDVKTASLPRIFKERFEQFIKRLQDKVIWRLQHERNQHRRNLIQQFPLQLETLEAGLANFIYQLTDIISADKLPLQGIYWVSNLQKGVPVDCLHKTSNQTLILPSSLTTLPISNYKQQAYFSHYLFKRINATNYIPPVARNKQRFTKQEKIRLSTYVLAVMIITSSGLLMARSFNQRVTNLNTVQTALAQYNVLAQELIPGETDLNRTMPALNILRQATVLLDKTKMPWFSSASHKLPPLADKAYHGALKTYFLPAISSQLEQALASSNNPELLYCALKTYLMLGDPSHRDPAFIEHWLPLFWQQQFAANPTLQKQLNEHLVELTTQPFSLIELNQNIINRARSTLTTAPVEQVAYAILKAQTVGETINPFIKTDEQAQIFNEVFGTHANNLTIASIYTAKKFTEVYLTRTASASMTALKGDWVLGKNAQATTNTTANLLPLTQQVRLLYLKDYAAQWQNLLKNLVLNPWQNWQQAQATLKDLVSAKSPLIAILQTINTNTGFTALTVNTNNFTNDDLQAIKDNLSNSFTDFASFTQSPDGHQPSRLNLTLVSLKRLQDQIEPAAHDKPNNKAAFLTTQARFQGKLDHDPIQQLSTLASVAPQPIQAWLNTMATDSWNLLLSSTAQYINYIWKDEVASFYQNKLNNRYPLFKSATIDADLDDFSHFFGKAGLLDHFFTTYLTTFINTEQTQWTWRTLDGKNLNLATDIIPQFERAAIIRTMFFDKDNQLHVPFSLKLIAFEPGVDKFGFKLNNQNFVDDAARVNIHALVWPGKDSESNITLSFTNEKNQTSTTHFVGPWALFRLLDKSSIESDDSSQRYQLTFDYNGNAARYELIANQLINPFIPGVVDQFRAPSILK